MNLINKYEALAAIEKALNNATGDLYDAYAAIAALPERGVGEAADHWRKIARDRYTAIAAERAKVARLVEVLREARSDLASYVDHDYPPETRAIYPSVTRQHFRDMELCRRIDAILSEAEARDD